jgi:hypothetical protein
VGVAGSESVAGRGEDSMGVAVEKMGRYAVNCKKTAACKSRKRSARGRERTLKLRKNVKCINFTKKLMCYPPEMESDK